MIYCNHWFAQLYLHCRLAAKMKDLSNGFFTWNIYAITLWSFPIAIGNEAASAQGPMFYFSNRSYKNSDVAWYYWYSRSLLSMWQCFLIKCHCYLLCFEMSAVFFHSILLIWWRKSLKIIYMYDISTWQQKKWFSYMSFVGCYSIMT